MAKPVRRRDIFPLAGLTAVTPLMAGDALAQPHYDPVSLGINLRLRWNNGWTVPVIDWDNLNEYWTPGQMPMFTDIPLKDYLAEIEKKLKLGVPPKTECE